jgi:hypothetical protein
MNITSDGGLTIGQNHTKLVLFHWSGQPAILLTIPEAYPCRSFFQGFFNTNNGMVRLEIGRSSLMRRNIEDNLPNSLLSFTSRDKIAVVVLLVLVFAMTYSV